MLDLEKDTAKRIIDALAFAIDGKKSSAKSFEPYPYENLADYGNWGQDNNDSKNDTPRTKALLLSYLILSGGRIPLRGIELHGAWFRPDKWVAGALVKKGYVTVDESAGVFLVTASGWAFVAETLEALSNLSGPDKMP
ncbi:hypothetical protein [Mesorhizobium australicum]|uniref:hypothetical protein n=1 Tax=Mesorhizobium australicum TaxID=536018 RepID=UPI00333889DE